MLDIRVRSKTSQEYLASVRGRILGTADVDCILTGKSRVTKPDGSLLCVYLPKAIPEDISNDAYAILRRIRGTTTNRGLASGTKRATPKHIGPEDPDRLRYRSYARQVMSNVIGAMEDTGAPEHRHCRLTAWTGEHLPEWRALQPYLQTVAKNFSEQVPERYAAQMREVEKTRPEWVVPGTPYTTITVNVSYATGVHVDDGDLPEGFSCLACIRRGQYVGGYLTFPEYRLAVNMQDRDLLLMDAHEWHGNTELNLISSDAERISIVFYFRTAMTRCGTFSEEQEKLSARLAKQLEPKMLEPEKEAAAIDPQ